MQLYTLLILRTPINFAARITSVYVYTSCNLQTARKQRSHSARLRCCPEAAPSVVVASQVDVDFAGLFFDAHLVQIILHRLAVVLVDRQRAPELLFIVVPGPEEHLSLRFALEEPLYLQWTVIALNARSGGNLLLDGCYRVGRMKVERVQPCLVPHAPYYLELMRDQPPRLVL